ncbi:MAG: class I SAM-dependent methyltransferase [Halobacteriales archaeon]|nr:class I SAM-dependent methyltransferase [Halobacteriales archaeon]
MDYVGRPGPSPVLAALFAAGTLRENDRILDLGCGAGLDAVALARWGCRDVTGVDVEPAHVAAARRRAARARLGHRVRFVEADACALQDAFGEGAFDVAWDGLLLNNLRGEDEARYARSVAHVLARDGLLALQFRVTKRAWERGAEATSPALERWFRFGPPASTLIPEHTGRPRVPPYARVAVQVGVRNARRA